MKAEPLVACEIGYKRCAASEATHIRLHMPGPLPNRILPVQPCSAHGWTWNQNVDAPTVMPSILTKGGGRICREGEYKEQVCHSFVSDGKVQFLTDCTHEFAGQTVDLLEID